MSNLNTALTHELLEVFDLTVPHQSKILKLKLLKKVDHSHSGLQRPPPLKCDGCGKCYETLEAFLIGCRQHVEGIKHLAPPDQADLFRRKRGRKIKILDAESVEIFQCRICPASFTSAFQYFDHIDCHENPWLLRCDVCDVVFKSGIQARKHSYRHHPELFRKQLVERSKLKGIYLTPEELVKRKAYGLIVKRQIKAKIQQQTNDFDLRKKFKIAEKIENDLRLRRHGVQSEQDLHCSSCKLNFLDLIKFRNHLVSKHHVDIPDFLNKDQLNECPLLQCRMKYPGKIYLVTHLLRNHPSELGQLCLNLANSNSSNQEDTHKAVIATEVNNNVPGPDTTLKCASCNVIYETSGTLLNHLRRHHDISLATYLNADGISTCPWCWQHFGRGVENHMQVTHPEELSQLLTDLGSFLEPAGTSFKNTVEKKKFKIDGRVEERKTNNFQCPLCPLTGFAISIRRHFNAIHNLYEEATLCPICKETWPSMTGKNHHMARRHQISWVEWLKKDTLARITAGEINFDYCQECLLPFKPHQLAGHQQVYHSTRETIVKCHHCTQTFATFLQRSQHERVNHPNRLAPIYSCDICGLTISNRTRLLNHMQLHMTRCETKSSFVNVEFFSCDECGAKFQSNQAVLVHKRKIHGELVVSNNRTKADSELVEPNNFTEKNKLKDYICDKCGVIYKTYSSFKKHQAAGECFWKGQDYTRRNKRRQEKTATDKTAQNVLYYQCETCSDTFVTQNMLTKHIEAVHNPSPTIYKCYMCSWVTKYRTRCKAHITRAHQRTKIGQNVAATNLHCPVCKVLIRNKRYYNSHLQLHGPKDKICQMCGRGFARQIDLNAHVKQIHWSNSKIKIQCRFCRDSFNNYCTRKRHEERVHGIVAKEKAKRVFLDVDDF